MSDPNLLVSIILRAVDQATAPLRAVTAQVESLGQAHRKMGEQLKALGEIGAGVLTGELLKRPLEDFAELEQQMTRMKVAFLDASGAVDPFFDAINQKTIQLGNLLPGTHADFAAVASTLKEMGESSKDIAAGALEAAARLKVVTGESGEAAARYAVQFSHSFGVAGGDLNKFADLVQRTQYGFGLKAGELAYSLEYLSPALHQLGIQGLDGAKTMMAIAGAANQAGVAGSIFGTGMKDVLERVANFDKLLDKGKNDEWAGKFKQLGIEMNFFKDGKFLGLENMVAQFEKLKALNPQDQVRAMHDLFGEQAGQMAGTLIHMGTAGLDKALGAMDGQADLGARMDTLMGTLENKWNAFTGTLKNMWASLASGFAEDLKPLIDRFNDLAGMVAGWAERHQGLTRILFEGAAGFAALAAAIGTVTVAVGIVGGAFGVIAGPVGLALAGIVAVALAAWALWGPLSRYYQGIADGFRSVMAPLDGVEAAFGQLGAAVRDLVAPLARLVGAADGAAPSLADLGHAVGVVLGGAFNATMAVVKLFVELLTHDIRLITDLIHGDFSGAAAELTGAWRDVAGFFERLLARVERAFQGALDVIKPIVETIKGLVADVIGGVHDLGAFATDNKLTRAGSGAFDFVANNALTRGLGISGPAAPDARPVYGQGGTAAQAPGTQRVDAGGTIQAQVQAAPGTAARVTGARANDPGINYLAGPSMVFP
jgi:TP901 family phage tail tape measure protein